MSAALRVRMNSITLYVWLAAAIQIYCHADVTKLSVEHRTTLLDSSRFQAIRAVTNLPPSVVTLCADDNGKLAGPGKKWEATDYITDPKLPTKRLIWGA